MGLRVNNRSVLVVEDEADIAQLLRLHLADFCDEIVVTGNGGEGLRIAGTRSWGLIILDLGLPGIGGLEICRRIRQRMAYTPILVLTAKDTEFDRVLGLETGADDYVTKPFCLPELMARVKAIFRRCAALQGETAANDEVILRHDDLVIDCTRRMVQVDAQTVELTAKEFDLLAHFARRPQQVFSRAQLLDQVWGYGHEGYEHTVNSHINRLRAKIEHDPSRPRHIVTVWGVGYKLGR
jgi:DNA-binding response OmpR family regulator